MSAPLFTVQVRDLDYGDRDLDEEIPVEWLKVAFEGTEATPSGNPGRLTATVSKTGRQILVRGEARADVTMPCARTLDPVQIPVRTDLFLVLEPRHEERQAPPKGERSQARAGQTSGTPRAATPGRAPVKGKRARGPADTSGPGGDRGPGPRRPKVTEDPVLSEEDAAQDTYDGEKVVLDSFIREFLVLELPLFPLRPDLRDLHSESTPASDVPPQSAPVPAERPDGAIDPRLAPLAAIASRLRQTAKKE